MGLLLGPKVKSFSPGASRSAGFWDWAPTAEEIREPPQLVRELTQGLFHLSHLGLPPTQRSLSSRCPWLGEGAVPPQGVEEPVRPGVLEERGGEEISW